jgi:RNA-directed DNA polymerase
VNSKPVKQLWLSLTIGDELGTYDLSSENPTGTMRLMERIIAPENLRAAMRRVRKNKGAPGVDGMTVNELGAYLSANWQTIREQLLAGTYEPDAVRRHEIKKDGGGMRVLGIPTVVDRFIQQAVLQVLQAEWDGTFSDASYGFRPGRSTRQAVERARGYYREGCRWVVDVDLEKFFDRVNHSNLMSLVRARVDDERVNRLITRFLKAGMLTGDVMIPRGEGTPQGGPLSPLLANLLLDQLDKELEKRQHRFVRYADDCNIYIKSRRAGQRVKASITEFLDRHLKLKVNEAKSAVARPRERSFLGFSIGREAGVRLSEKTLKRVKARIRKLTQRTRGRSLRQVIGELGKYMRGWLAYYSYATGDQFRMLQAWLTRRLRCYQWKQWGGRGYRELRKRGVSRDLAWNTSKSAHGPWRISMSPALSIALPTRYFLELGLPSLCR